MYDCVMQDWFMYDWLIDSPIDYVNKIGTQLLDTSCLVWSRTNIIQRILVNSFLIL